MRRVALVFTSVSLLAGCHSKPEERHTTFVTRTGTLESRLVENCSQYTERRHMSDAASPEVSRAIESARCLPKPDFGGGTLLHLRWTTNFTNTAEGYEICRLNLGPDLLRAPLSTKFVSTFIRDRSTAEKLKTLLDTNGELRNELKLVGNVDGISVHVDVAPMPDGPSIEIELDGCERLARSNPWADMRAPVDFGGRKAQ